MSDERGPDLVELVAEALKELRKEHDCYLPTHNHIAKAAITALEPHIQQRERAAKREVLKELRQWLSDLVAARHEGAESIFDDGYDTGVNRAIKKIETFILAATTDTAADRTEGDTE